MDIGGSLVKIAYSSSFDCKTGSLHEVIRFFLKTNLYC